MGDSPDESVTLKVILVFLLPLIVFIVSLAVSERALAGIIKAEGLQIILSFLLALLATFILVLITKVLCGQVGLNK